ncbi:MAG: RDD family protein [Chloroflexota bacterium]|jgi:uncharacterized RDD family membrane protein YckC
MSELIEVGSNMSEEQRLMAQPGGTLREQPAGFVSRFIAFVIDLLIITASTTAVAISVGLILSFFNLDLLAAPQSADEGGVLGLVRAILLGLSIGANFLFVTGYLILFWLLTGQTPGKSFVGLRVVSVDGRPLRGRQALRRLVGYWLSALPLFAGFLWVLIDDERRGWHDRFAGTQVVYAWEARMGRRFVEVMHERRRQLEAADDGVD